MNTIEEESTFFVTIEKNNMKNQIQNFKNMKSKYFCHPIKSIRKKQNVNHKCSLSFPNKNIKNFQQAKTPQTSIETQLKKINNINITKINIMQNYLQNEKQSNNFLLGNENKNNDNIEENIDIEDDIDEFDDVRCNININKPKLPFYNKNYYNDNSLSISRNILNNFLNKTSYSSKKNKVKDYHNKCKFHKNKSCYFINDNLLKLKLNQNIIIANSKIEMLKNLIKRRNLQILSIQLFFEKNNVQHKIRKNFRNLEKKEDEQRKEIFDLKIQKEKCEEKYISKKIHENDIKQENLKFSDKKLEIIEKILDIKMKIFNNNRINNINSNSNLHNFDESTIINDSNIFDNEYNILETKENIKSNEENILKNNRITNEKNEEKINKINHNEINCIKNKNTSNYFASRFCIETKALNKNKFHKKYNHNPNSKFNIFINYNNGK